MVLSAGVGVYLFNVFCAMVPCSVTQPPTQAFIQDANNNFNNWDPSSSTPVPFTNLPTSLSASASIAKGQIVNAPELVLDFSPDELELGPRSKRLLNQPRFAHRRNHNSMQIMQQFQQQPAPSENWVRSSRMTENENDDSNHVPDETINRRDDIGISSSGGGGGGGSRSRTESLGQGLGRRSPMISSLFSAVPVIPVLLNNFDNLWRSVSRSSSFSSSSSDDGGNDGIASRIGRQQSFSSSNFELPFVSTQDGDLEGYFMGTMKGRRIAAYEGIPYAQPPTGKNRFKSPVPKFPWKTVLQAKKTGSNCLQAHPLDFFRVTGSEDCLYLNIYTPQYDESATLQKYPVVFLIHGGSFQYGSSAEYGASYLLDEDVILVTVNYRLGPLGFMSTGDDHSPGNYGLKDQALALKWIYANIASFGGDKDRITIMGQSAGGVSAHLHLISNKTTPYFHNGVSLSGSAFGFWPIISKKRSMELSQKLASVLNCPRSNSREMVRCLRSANPHLITASQMQLYEWIPFHPLVLFGPVLEDEENPDAFLTKRPEAAYQAGQVMNKSWVFGQTSQEGHFDIYFMKLMMQSVGIALNGRKYLPIILDYGRKTRQARSTSEVTDKILKFYGGALIGRGIDLFSISPMYTDRFYTSTIRQAIKAHAAIAPDSTFAYIFDYKGKYNLGSLFGSQESEWGVSHTEDMFYYFNSSVYHHGLQRDDPEYGLSQIMTDFLANFISTGTPMHINANNAQVPFWDPVLPNQNNNEPLQYLRIRKDISMIDDPFFKRVEFWDTLNL